MAGEQGERGASGNNNIPAGKMAAINRVQYNPPPLSFCEGPRILQKLRDVVVQIVELPLYILSSLVGAKRIGHGTPLALPG